MLHVLDVVSVDWLLNNFELEAANVLLLLVRLGKVEVVAKAILLDFPETADEDVMGTYGASDWVEDARCISAVLFELTGKSDAAAW